MQERRGGRVSWGPLDPRRRAVSMGLGPSTVRAAERLFNTFIRFQPDLLDVGRPALGQLRVICGHPIDRWHCFLHVRLY
jgi:hypothetical protein